MGRLLIDKNIYGNVGNYFNTDIEHTHICFKSLRPLKEITRYDQKSDKLDRFYVDESYVFNSLKGDIKEMTMLVPEVWEADMLGGITNTVFVNKQPLPYQYRSLSRPWKVELPYYGMEISTLMGNSKNVAPIDLGKPWQGKFNVEMARLEEMEKTDLGKVLLMSTAAIPDNWDLGKFFNVMKYGKTAVVNLQKEGMNPLDAQQIRSLDLSNMKDITSRLQYLEWISGKVATAMSYNGSRLGDISPYTTVSNNQQNIAQSSNQTEDIFQIHNKVVERVLNAVVHAARVAYKYNNKKASFLLSDMSTAELDLDWELLWRSEIGINLTNSFKDYNKLKEVEQQMQPMIQNGLLSFREMIMLKWAKSFADVLNIADRVDLRQEKLFG